MDRPPDPVGLYEPYRSWGGLVILSAISSARDGIMITGKVGRDLDFATAQQAARQAAENLLGVMLDSVGGDVRRIEQLLLVRGQVNAADDFTEVHKVIDAASELLVARLGDRGRHARTAIGCATLPNNNAVTLEAMAVVRLD